MKYRNFIISPNVEDRREELSGLTGIDQLIQALRQQEAVNPMMANAAGPEPALTTLGKQAGMLDIEPAMREIQMARARQELADLLNARNMRAARGFDEPMDPNSPPVRLDRRLNRSF